MNEWLSARADELAEAGPAVRGSLDLTAAEIETLLDVAGFAAHDSGARTNAPLLCYLLGRATAGGATLDELVAAVRASTS
ncbi:MAG TPA: DUF6457 domain-containing protein [Gaiellaceae bacterium]|nr:DUF6457 domain-containing protein [Gaiellaceae bacterium]